ncbi:MAG TPA: response regulator [Bryobacteraceae bacterium]|nr:response regulator [Bryobacteraceae bacterium]
MGAAKILIVDDEVAIRGLLKSAVGGPEVNFFEADSAEGALDFARRNPPFDLVITDIFMKGMNGIDMARRLREGGHAAKFLFLSGYCDLNLEDMLSEDFDARFLPKPFALTELVATVRILLEARQWRMQSPPRMRRRA